MTTNVILALQKPYVFGFFLTDVGMAFESTILNKDFYLLMVTKKDYKV